MSAGSGAIRLTIAQFSLIYLLLLVVVAVFRANGIHQSKLLLWASLRMTVQLVLVGLILQYIFGHPRPVFTVCFLVVTIAFSIHRVLSIQPGLNARFRWAVAAAMGSCGLLVLIYFVCAVVREDIFNPQYTIPLSGMIIGNAMTALTLGLKSFRENLNNRKAELQTLLNLGVEPKRILRPLVSTAMETALLPNINSMLGMGIIFLPGMMTGQMLSGTMPTTAIMYQIAIMIAISCSQCLTVFFALHFGYQSLYNKHCQFIWTEKKPSAS